MSNNLFEKNINKKALDFSTSLPVDIHLYEEDIQGSMAHVKMLMKTKILPSKDCAEILGGLIIILEEFRAGKIRLVDLMQGEERFANEDIHMAIEKLLIAKVGEVGKKLHTARSRNDQIATDEMLWMMKNIPLISTKIENFMGTLVTLSEKYIHLIIPGYTHTQQAQPISLAHHLMAYVEMLNRDDIRFVSCLGKIKNPLGSCALAGTTLPIDRGQTTKELGFKDYFRNSMDAISSRDIQIEFVSACSIIMMHLSRLSEDVILWNTSEFNFINIGDDFLTGSSIMPQKRNPDIAELVRGKTGSVYGDLISLLTMMKGLPMSYNRDMQEDKVPLLHAFGHVFSCLDIYNDMFKTVTFNARNLYSDHYLATYVAEYLVNRGMAFREAHTLVGNIVDYMLANQENFSDFSAWDSISDLFEENFYNNYLLERKHNLNGYQSLGSTSKTELEKAIKLWKVYC